MPTAVAPLIPDLPGTPDVPQWLDKQRFLLLGEVLEVHRGHYLRPAAPLSTTPSDLDDCCVVQPQHVHAFHVAGRDAWTSYNSICDAFKQARSAGSRSHITPVREGVVFSPVKLLLAERDRPLRAALFHPPAYPTRSKVLVPRQGQSSWMAYAALAVLNSAIGQALYHHVLTEARNHAHSPDGPPRQVLLDLPIATRNYAEQQLERVVSLTHQITTLYEAQQECRIDLGGIATGLRERLLCEVCALLSLTESEARRLLAAIADHPCLPDLPSSDGQLSLPGLGRPDWPSLPPVRLLSPKQREAWNELDGEARRRQPLDEGVATLKLLAYWEDCVNATPPGPICQTTWDALDSLELRHPPKQHVRAA